MGAAGLLVTVLLLLLLIRWFKGEPPPAALPHELETGNADDEHEEFVRAAARLEEAELKLTTTAVHDPAVWDEYWASHLADTRLAGLALMSATMFCDDRALIELMKSQSMRTVLCVGNGTSGEPKALARAGFSVVALDLSQTATDWARSFDPPDKFFRRFLDPEHEVAGGHVEFVTGNLLDMSVCPGPFEVIIERKTVQLFSDDERGTACEALASRLSDRGIIYSQCHDGSWRPGEPHTHTSATWFKDRGWAIWGGTPPAVQGRVAWLAVTTG